MPNAYEVQEDTSTTQREPSGHVISPEMQACCLELSGPELAGRLTPSTVS